MANQYKATDAAERRAKELEIDLSTVEGTGKEGQITVQDVEAATPVERDAAANRENAAANKKKSASSENVRATKVRSTEVARRKANAYGFDVEAVAAAGYASGPDGSVTVNDVDSFNRDEGEGAELEPGRAYMKLLGRGTTRNVPGTGFTATYKDNRGALKSATVSRRVANVFDEQAIEAILETGRETYGLEEGDFQITPVGTGKTGTSAVASSRNVRKTRGALAVSQPGRSAAGINDAVALRGSGPTSDVPSGTGPGTPGNEVPEAGSKTEERNPANDTGDDAEGPIG